MLFAIFTEIFIVVFLAFLILCVFWMIDFIMFDNLFANKVQRWAKTKFDDGCNKDCNQGRRCNCSGEYTETDKTFDPHAR